MTAAIHIADATKDVTGMAVRVGGSLKTVTEGWVRVGGTLKQFYALLTITLSTYSAIGRGNSATVLPVTSQPVTASVTGTVGTVTHVWTRTAADAQPWTINANGATATFTTSCDQGDSFTATFIDTITDQAGQTITSAPVTVSCANIYYGGGYPGIIPGIPGEPYP